MAGTMSSQKRGGMLLLGWLIPGAGYLYLGYPWKTAALFSLLAAVYFTGIVIGNGQSVLVWDNFSYMVSFCIGSFAIIQLFVSPQMSMIPYIYPYSLQLSALYITTASLLNLLLLVDVYCQSVQRFRITLGKIRESQETPCKI